jgi:hypothetical protein
VNIVKIVKVLIAPAGERNMLSVAWSLLTYHLPRKSEARAAFHPRREERASRILEPFDV